MRVIAREESAAANAQDAAEIQVWWEAGYGYDPPRFHLKVGLVQLGMSIESAEALCRAMRFTLDGPPKERA